MQKKAFMESIFILSLLITILPLILFFGVVVFLVIYLVKTFKPYLDKKYDYNQKNKGDNANAKHTT